MSAVFRLSVLANWVGFPESANSRQACVQCIADVNLGAA